MQQQVSQCKTLIGQLTQRAGVTRADTTAEQNVAAWLTGVIARWRSLRPDVDCRLTVSSQAAATQPLSCPATIAQALEQAVGNLLGNAAKAAPAAPIGVELTCDVRELCIVVSDRGDGFSPQVLANSGSEPLAPHEDGAGIGLWLTRAAVERAGGRLVLDNSATGGRATLILTQHGETT
jgi:two-component system sensor histidine kinase RegB